MRRNSSSWFGDLNTENEEQENVMKRSKKGFTEILSKEYPTNDRILAQWLFQDIQLDNDFEFPLELSVWIKYYQSESTKINEEFSSKTLPVSLMRLVMFSSNYPMVVVDNDLVVN